MTPSKQVLLFLILITIMSLITYLLMFRLYKIVKNVEISFRVLDSFPLYLLVISNLNSETFSHTPRTLLKQMKLTKPIYLCSSYTELINSFEVIKNSLSPQFLNMLISSLSNSSNFSDKIVQITSEIVYTSILLKKEMLSFFNERERIVFFLVVFAPLSLFLISVLINYNYLLFGFLCELLGILFCHFSFTSFYSRMQYDMIRGLLIEEY